jgi:hypothetical protein
LTGRNATSIGPQRIAIDEPGFVHRQLSLSAVTGAVTAVMRILQGDGIVVPYASIVDNITAEAVFVSGEPISRHGMNGLAMLASTVK